MIPDRTSTITETVTGRDLKTHGKVIGTPIARRVFTDGGPVQEPPNEPKKPPVEEPGERPDKPPIPKKPPVEEPWGMPPRPPVKELPPRDPKRL